MAALRALPYRPHNDIPPWRGRAIAYKFHHGSTENTEKKILGAQRAPFFLLRALRASVVKLLHRRLDGRKTGAAIRVSGLEPLPMNVDRSSRAGCFRRRAPSP